MLATVCRAWHHSPGSYSYAFHRRMYSKNIQSNEDQGKHVPYGSTGSSMYSLSTKICFDVIQKASPLVLNCVKQIIEFRNATMNNNTDQMNHPFTIADIGCADGGTSLFLIYDIISMIRNDTNHKHTPIQIIYEDQPINDWNSLFNNIQNQNNSNPLDITDPKYYYMSNDLLRKNVFVYVNGTSFYKQCFMNNSIDLIFSSSSMHWMSTKPCIIPNCIHSALLNPIKNSTDYATKKRFEKQAFDDWNVILHHRCKELKKHGKMVIACFGEDQYGQYLGNTFSETNNNCNNTRNMFEVMNEILEDMLNDGVISQYEFGNITFPQYYRTLRDVINFDANDIDLKVKHAESGVVRCPFHSKYIESAYNTNKENVSLSLKREYAKHFIPTIRTWSNSVFVSGLNEQRSEFEKNEIVNEFFDRYQTKVEKNPDQHAMDCVHHYLVFSK